MLLIINLNMKKMKKGANMETEITKPQTIIGLVVENVKKIKLVELSPDGKTILITGANQQGKTSLVDGIWWAIGGKNAMRKTSEPIREGEGEARAVVEFQDFIAERRITRKSSYLYVTLKDEAHTKVTNSPQDFLNKFLGTISVDPTEILRMTPKEQVDTLLKLFGIYDQVSNLELKYQDFYNKRHAIGQQRDSAVGAFENMEVPPKDYIRKERSIAELSKNLTDTINFNNNLAQANRNIQQKEIDINGVKNVITGWQEQIQVLQDKIKKANEDIVIENQQLSKLREQVEGVGLKDIAPLETEIAQAEAINIKVREVNKWHEFGGKVTELKSAYSTLGEECEAIQKQKQEILQTVEMPVPGLSIDDRGLVFGPTKRPMEQLSDSEQHMIAGRIAMAEKPTIRILRITHGEGLDDKTFGMYQKMADEHGYQLIVEKVDTSGKLGIVLEEGEVIANNEALTHSETKEV